MGQVGALKGKNGGRTCNISVPTACMILIQPFALVNASSLSLDLGGPPSKLENGWSIMILSLCFLHRCLTSTPAEQRLS